MKIGLGLYRHMLSRDNYDFARQAGCTHLVIHLVDYFRQNSTNPRDNQPTGGKYEPWGVAGDPGTLWTAAELISIRREIEDAGLVLAAIENMLRIMSILHRTNFDGVILPDHTPQMTCAAPWHAGMAHTIGFVQAALAMFRNQTDAVHNHRGA
jgi:D-mannonate dehydratase